MSYYIFEIRQQSGGIIKKLTMLYKFDEYREAKSEIRKLRSAQLADGMEYKIIFADSELQAEELLQEKREAPILMEWEK